jgi:hypothetical protein
VVEIENDSTNKEYHEALATVPGLDILLNAYDISKKDRDAWKELILHALAEFEVISKDLLQTRITFSDPLADMLEDLD